MKTRTPRSAKPPREELRQKILEDFQVLGIPLKAEPFDAVMTPAEREGMSHLELSGADRRASRPARRERSVANRIRDAGFRESKTLADFDWLFNAATIDRVRIEGLATAAFIGRRENLVLVGQSGVGKVT